MKSLLNSMKFSKLFQPVVIALGLLAVVAQSVSAHTEVEKRQIENKAYSASPIPDRVILNLTAQPATSQAITWRTDNSVSMGQAQIAIASGSPDFVETAVTLEAKTEHLFNNRTLTYHHSVIFEDLQPNTLYAYRVGDGDLWSEWFQFTTASDQNDAFSFIYFGDAQNDVKSMWSRVVRQAYKNMPEVNFMLHVGDLINVANADNEWGEWFYAGGWLNGMVPSIMTPGNHEYSGLSLSKQWRPHFTLPENGPKKPYFRVQSTSETAYFIDYQGMRIISIDSQIMLTEATPKQTLAQKEWLENLLQNNPNQWTVVTHHHPMFSVSERREGHEQLNLYFKDLYEKYGVDLVLQGHDHSYGRGENIPAGDRVGDEHGPMYVVSVSGPKQYEADGEWADVVLENSQLYQLISIDGSTLSYRAYNAAGEMKDIFQIIKHSDGSKEVLEPGISE